MSFNAVISISVLVLNIVRFGKYSSYLILANLKSIRALSCISELKEMALLTYTHLETLNSKYSSFHDSKQIYAFGQIIPGKSF